MFFELPLVTFCESVIVTVQLFQLCYLFLPRFSEMWLNLMTCLIFCYWEYNYKGPETGPFEISQLLYCVRHHPTIRLRTIYPFHLTSDIFLPLTVFAIPGRIESWEFSSFHVSHGTQGAATFYKVVAVCCPLYLIILKCGSM